MDLRHGCRQRVDAVESFDEAGLEPAFVARYLRDLEKVNSYLLGTHSILVHVAPLLADGDGTPLRVLDIGCGGGGVLRALARRARRERRSLVGIGLDRSPAAVAYARRRAAGFPELTWLCADAMELPFAPRSMDVVISTTVLHHFPPEQASALLQRARSVARGPLVISDLVRSYAAVLAFRAFSRLTGFCRESREDGIVSVCRAYRPEELTRIASDAGLANCRIYRYPFARMTLVCGPPEEDDGTEPRGQLR